MDRYGGHVNEIRNILEQVSTTKIEIGHTIGNFISSAQLAAILDSLEGIDNHEDNTSEFDYINSLRITPDSTVIGDKVADDKQLNVYLNRLQEVNEEIRQLEVKIVVSEKSARSALNISLGKLKSEHSRLNKAIKSRSQ